MVDVGVSLMIIFILAFLIESLVEAVLGTPFDKIEKLKPYKWTLMYIALLAGIIGAFVYRFDLLFILGGYIGARIEQTSFGIALTGLAIGRGSNYLHDLVTNLLAGKVVPSTTITTNVSDKKTVSVTNG